MKRVESVSKTVYGTVFVFTVLFSVWSQQTLMADFHQTVSVQWKKRELRPALEQLAQVGHFNYYLDRRVDPGLTIEMQFRNQPVREILNQVAEHLGYGYCEVGNIAYIGPKETTEILPFLLVLKQDELAKLSRVVIDQFSLPCDFHSNFLDTPVEVLQGIAEHAKCNPKVFGNLPHDLWPELSFSQVMPLELFTVLLGSFDMTFRISRNGKTVTPVFIEREKRVSHEYPLSRQETKPWIATYPNLSFQFARDKLRVEGSLSDIAKWDIFYRQQFSAESSGSVDEKTKTTSDQLVPLSHRRFTATISEQPIRLVLASYAKTLETEIVIDEESFKKKGSSLDQRVSFELKNATLDESLQKCLDPISGAFQISESEIRVFAK